MITQNRVKELFDYDVNSGNLTWKIAKSTKTKIGAVAGVIAPNGYRVIKVDYKLYQAHRLIWLFFYGQMPAQCIDHVDGNKSNNLIGNLRQASNAENQQNIKKANTRNAHGFLGCAKDKKRWRATIYLSGKKIHIGCFNTAEEAHAAYLMKKRELHPFQTIA